MAVSLEEFPVEDRRAALPSRTAWMHLCLLLAARLLRGVEMLACVAMT